MNQLINEPIKVAGIYQHSNFKPIWFEWSCRQFKINKITLISDYKQGEVKYKIYSVVVEGNLYRLVFNLVSHDWELYSVWIDGI